MPDNAAPLTLHERLTLEIMHHFRVIKPTACSYLPDAQTLHDELTALIEGVLADYTVMSKKASDGLGDEIEQLRAGCKKALEALDAWQDYSHRISEDDGDEYDAQDCCGAFDRASNKTIEARTALKGETETRQPETKPDAPAVRFVYYRCKNLACNRVTVRQGDALDWVPCGFCGSESIRMQ